MELILDNIPELVFYKDAENNLIRVNKYFADRHKLNKKEIEGKSCFDLYSKEQAQAYWDDDLEVINSGKPKLNIVEPWETEDGIRWLNTNKIPIFNEKGKCTCIIGFSIEITEQVKAKAEIHKLSAYNRNLIKVSLDPLATIDQDGKIMDVNFATETITGHSREELIGTEFSSYFTELEKATEVYKRVFEMGSVQDYELSLQHVDGHVTPVLYNASIFKDENGKVMGVFAAARDITKRKLIEKKLKEYSRNLEDIVEKRTEDIRREMEKAKMYLDISACIILVLNSDGVIELVNKKGCEILGYDEEQLIGKNWFDNFIPKENKEEIKSVFRKLMAGEIEPVEYYENLNLTKNGIEKIIAWYNNILKDEQGNIIGTLSSGEDITERKKVEEVLRESEERLNAFMESATDGFFLYNSELNIINVNKAGLSLWPAGTKKEDLIGKNMLDFAAKIKESGRYDKYMEVIKTGTPFFVEDVGPHPEFGEIHLAISAFKVCEGMGLISTNITERKKAEQNLLSTLENLKRVNIELERFAYVASHDLQEPLRMIVSFIQLFEKRYKDKLDEDADDFIAFIVDGAKRMQALINDLLIYSRIGKKDKQHSHLDINIVIKDVINNLRKTIEETNAKITHDPLPTIVANEVEFIQLLQNLISNAIKFHKEEEPPVVHISAKLQNMPKNCRTTRG
jgi:PAS domain S-box-containing protein